MYYVKNIIINKGNKVVKLNRACTFNTIHQVNATLITTIVKQDVMRAVIITAIVVMIIEVVLAMPCIIHIIIIINNQTTINVKEKTHLQDICLQQTLLRNVKKQFMIF